MGRVFSSSWAAEPLPALYRCSGIGVVVGRRDDRGEQPIVEALVIALEMVMRDKLRDRRRRWEVALSRNELVQALFLNREYEALDK
jgi:hypothetical protein